MDEGFPFLDIIFLAMIAAFIGLRLRGVLGRRTGHERRADEPLAGDTTNGSPDNVVKLPSAAGGAENTGGGDPATDIPLDSPLARDIARVAAANRGFKVSEFLSGARGAYEIIIAAFAAGDRAGLKKLLSGEVFTAFSEAISVREKARQTAEARVIEIISTELTGAKMNDRMAEVTVRFTADLLNVTRDAEGQIVDGNASDAERVRELWTFAHEGGSRDPNWILISTQSEA